MPTLAYYSSLSETREECLTWQKRQRSNACWSIRMTTAKNPLPYGSMGCAIG